MNVGPEALDRRGAAQTATRPRRASAYDTYIREEWRRFVDDPARAAASLDAVAGLAIARVLDVGCGAGQELLPFVRDLGAIGFGIDFDPEAGDAGRELLGNCGLDGRVVFVRAQAEALPFLRGSFDVVICRLALPYTDNVRALAELARVLRDEGVLLLKIHHARYYLDRLARGMRERDLGSMIHAARALAAGTLYHLTGRQLRNRLLGRETFQTASLLRRELARRGLWIRGEMPDSNPATPSFIIMKTSGVSR